MTLRRTTQGNRRFLVSELPHLALLRTAFNVLAFRMSNVAFSVVVGLLLVLGAYGRTIGNLPADSPYARPRPLAWNRRTSPPHRRTSPPRPRCGIRRSPSSSTVRRRSSNCG
jgi:hypothetical protein